MCIPACSQIWARVIQGWSGPCLGALLCREEATSDRACSTRLAAMDVACTEPGGKESITNQHTRHLLHVLTYCYGSVRIAMCHHAGFKINQSKQQIWMISTISGKNGFIGEIWRVLFAVKSSRLHTGTQFPESTPFHTLQHTVLWPWINQVRVN